MNKKRKRTELTIEEEILLNRQTDEDSTYRCEFATRINKLMAEKEISPKDLEIDWNIKQNTLTNYRRGRVDPQLTVIVKLAKALEVPIDYLCGLSEYSGSDVEDYDINKKTGLSNQAIGVLKEYNSINRNYVRTINFLLEQETLPLLENKIKYIKDTSSSKYIRLKKLLNKRDYTPIIRVIHEYFLTKVRKNKEIYINDSPIFIDNKGKEVSIDDTISTNKSIITKRSISTEMVIDNTYLDDIKVRLKQAKPKYISQFPSEVDNQ